jgi:hypothetical protein
LPDGTALLLHGKMAERFLPAQEHMVLPSSHGDGPDHGVVTIEKW